MCFSALIFGARVPFYLKDLSREFGEKVH